MDLTPASLRMGRIWTAVLQLVCNDDFVVCLPEAVPQASWQSICRWEERTLRCKCLAFLGDSILQHSLSVRLFHDEDSECGTMARVKSVLQSNLVLALLAEKSDPDLTSYANKPSILDVVNGLLERDQRSEKVAVMSVPRSAYKPLADRFEALLGHLSELISNDAAHQWVLATFEPLIAAGLAADKLEAARTGKEMSMSSMSDWSESSDNNIIIKREKRKREEEPQGPTSVKRTKAGAELCSDSEGNASNPCLGEKLTVVPVAAETIDLARNDYYEAAKSDLPTKCPLFRPIVIDLNKYDYEHDSDWSDSNRSEIEYEDDEDDDAEDSEGLLSY
ncbi:hypothetical protein PENSPDRAFT_738785 [Peniophora sp. CONT]|nr:hypothetical protein PENSPDRAFT_738785 [Peniophora sp. CONT]